MSIIVSQRDSRWSGIKLGTSNTTIGSHGCCICSLGYLVGLTPDKVNERLLAVSGYANGNLVIWSKTAEAIGVASYRYTTYNNEAVVDAISKNGAVLGEVDAKAIGGTGKHWVVMTGNGKVQDPWFGEERPTSNYTFTGYTVVVFDKTKLGQYGQSNIYRGLDLTNKESMMVCVDTQILRMEGKLVDIAQYESVKGQLTEVQKQNDELSKQLGVSNSEKQALTNKVQSLNNIVGEYQKEDAVQLSDLRAAQEERLYYKNKLERVLWDIEDELKLSHPNGDIDERYNVLLEALQSLLLEYNISKKRITELENEVKRLNTYRQPIAKLTTRDLLLFIARRLAWWIK